VGNPKARLRFGDEPLIMQIARVLKADFDDIVVVAAPNQEFPPLPARAARDEVPFQRPAVGVF
jgi:molybdopterin-guanine dinucleotide biosynthesis protein A